MTYLMIEGRREGYGPDQLRKTMTVGELMDYLSQFDEETPVILNNDNGYTYGSITYDSFMDGDFDEDGNPMDREEE
jgi:hypothetical protein